MEADHNKMKRNDFQDKITYTPTFTFNEQEDSLNIFGID